MSIRVPDSTNRTVVIGRTGSGKTVFGVELLSLQNFHEMPWVIIDFKGDELINKVVSQNKVREISVKGSPPKSPGLYVMYPKPLVDDELLEKWLMKCWAQESIGLYIDEGYALPRMGKTQAFTLILTQGRSKNVPVIILYQRPVFMNLFSIAQANFFAVFDQNIETDLKKTAEFITPAITPDGRKISVFTKLPNYYSLWHDVSEGRTNVLLPTPGERSTLQRFRDRLTPQKQRRFI